VSDARLYPPPAFDTGFAGKLAALARIFPPTFARGLRQAALFGNLETVCLFIGYPRSGHTLVGSLLDAHPDAVIAHEMDLLRFVYARFFRDQLCAMLVDNARADATRGTIFGGYSYAVPDAWQGRFRRIRVIGDKHGEATTIRLHYSPRLLGQTMRTFRRPLKMIHVVRNPYDNITTIARKIHTIHPGLVRAGQAPLPTAIEYYFTLCETVKRVRETCSPAMIDVRHEAFVASPASGLRRIGAFLNLPMADDYLRVCATVVYDRPRASRTQADWTPALIADVQDRMRGFPFLDGYRFDA
jgi:Sulfotransferase family